jgi:AraC-like DNA-binding protein
MKEILNIGILLGIFQGVTFAIALFFKKYNRLTNRCLALLLLTFSLSLANEAAYLNDVKWINHYCLDISVALELCFGPFFLLYIRFFSHTFEKFKKKYLLHFLPALLYIIYTIIDLQVIGNTVYLAEHGMLKILVHLQLVIYFILSFKALIAFNQYLSNTYSSIYKVRKLWIRLVIAFLIINFSLDFLFDIIRHIKIMNSHVLSLHNIGIIIIILWISFFSIWQLELFKSISLVEKQKASGEQLVKETELHNTNPHQTVLTGKYQRNRLNDSEAKQLYQELLEFMDRSKPYKTTDLTLPLLASKLKTTTHCLSQIINRYTSMNFYNFINLYRVNEAKRLMDDEANTNKKIINIIYESGFNSKSVFNNFFKKFIGQNPSEYRRHNYKEV